MATSSSSSSFSSSSSLELQINTCAPCSSGRAPFEKDIALFASLCGGDRYLTIALLRHFPVLNALSVHRVSSIDKNATLITVDSIDALIVKKLLVVLVREFQFHAHLYPAPVAAIVMLSQNIPPKGGSLEGHSSNQIGHIVYYSTEHESVFDGEITRRMSNSKRYPRDEKEEAFCFACPYHFPLTPLGDKGNNNSQWFLNLMSNKYCLMRKEAPSDGTTTILASVTHETRKRGVPNRGSSDENYDEAALKAITTIVEALPPASSISYLCPCADPGPRRAVEAEMHKIEVLNSFPPGLLSFISSFLGYW